MNPSTSLPLELPLPFPAGPARRCITPGAEPPIHDGVGMSTMVERVARAICWKNGMNPDITLGGDGVNFLWREYEGQARAAIEAMRELPPQDMILAGYQALMDWDARTGEDHGIFEVWQAMIDAALSGDA